MEAILAYFATMKLVWTKKGIPHGFLNATPVHLIYRVNGCAPVKDLRRLADDLADELKLLRLHPAANPESLQLILENYARVYDEILDAQTQSQFVLSRGEAAEIVLDSWKQLQRMGEIMLYAVCVMGNHVHVVLRGATVEQDIPVGQLVNRHKRYTNRVIRNKLGIDADTWDSGFYDRYIRPRTFWKVLAYVLENPVKAHLVAPWDDWPHTYVDPRCVLGLRERGLIS